MPYPYEVGLVPQQQLNQIPGPPPPEVIAAMQGRYDPSVHQWNPQTMTLTGPEGEYYFGADSYNPYEANPANGTNVVIDGVTQNFAQGVTPYTFLGGGQAQTVAEGSPEYHALRDDARTRNQQGLARIATLVGGGAALGATGSGPVFGGSSAAGTTAAQTFPYNSGGPVTVSSIPGVTAGTTAAGVGGAAAAGGSAVGGAGSGIGGAVANGIDWASIVPSIVSGLTGIAGANANADASRDALALSERMYNQTREDALPLIRAGQGAVGLLDRVQGLTSGTPDMTAFTQSPDYQFNLGEGQKAIDRSLAARGRALSGAGVKEGIRYASGMAANQYGSFVDRLLATAGLGTTGAATSANAGSNFAANGGNAIQNRGAARSSGYGAVNDAVQGGYANILLNRYLNRAA